MKNIYLVTALLVNVLAPNLASAAAKDLSCGLAFTGNAWSAVVERGTGTGTVTCSDGSELPVVISAMGVGITAGRWSVDNGHGKFTHVRNIDDVIGSYAALGVDAGLDKSGTAQVLTKGSVSLALEGTGRGIDLGLSITDFKIERVSAPRKAAKPVVSK
ncbi:MAG: hypothetical protein ACN6RK_05010 [Stenotrophomonas sp.]